MSSTLAFFFALQAGSYHKALAGSGTHYIDQTDKELTDTHPLDSATQVLELKARTATIPGITLDFFETDSHCSPGWL